MPTARGVDRPAISVAVVAGAHRHHSVSVYAPNLHRLNWDWVIGPIDGRRSADELTLVNPRSAEVGQQYIGPGRWALPPAIAVKPSDVEVGRSTRSDGTGPGFDGDRYRRDQVETYTAKSAIS